MLVIIDGNSVAYRAYHTAPPLTASDGTPTGVLHIFFTILDKVNSTMQKIDGDSRLIAVFDARGKNHRHELYPEYKANRLAMPEDLSVQLDTIKKILPVAGVPVYSMSGFEADDIIATLARNSQEPVCIVTKDKDLYQLVTDNVKIFDYQVGKLLGEKETVDKYGIAPSQMLDYLSLVGDKSDNVPGVTGVGEVTAKKLINDYKTLEGIYENILQIKGKVKENLLKDKEKAFTAKELITLVNVDPLAEPELAPNQEEFAKILSRYQLRTTLAKLDNKVEKNTTKKASEPEIEPDVLIDDMPQEIPLAIIGDVNTPELLISIDGSVFVSQNLTYEEYNAEKHKIADITDVFDIKNLYKKIGFFNDKASDLLLISWLTDPDKSTLQKAKAENIDQFIGRVVTLKTIFKKKLHELNLEKLYYEIELPIAKILADAEIAGIGIDVTKVQEVSVFLKAEISKLTLKLYETAGHELNLNSPKQLGVFLYEELGIKPPKKTKTGFSTAEDVLQELLITTPEHGDIINDILLFREYSKLLSTYTQSLLDCRNADGRIHTDFKQTGTATGRLSSVNPNLQNIPAKGVVATKIRSAFIPKQGYKFISIDYSQIELRILAHFSKDKMLQQAFINNEDIHTTTAMNIFHKSADEVTFELRRMAKAVNFGILYGLSAFGLSRDTKVSPKEAKQFIDAYFALYPNIKKYIEDIIATTTKNGYCETVLGRKRFFPDIKSRNALIRQRAERAAINAPIQGSAADIIKVAMIHCDNYLKEKQIDARLLLQLHDELILEVKAEIANDVMNEIKSIMQNAYKLAVPLTVNMAIGSNWGELK